MDINKQLIKALESAAESAREEFKFADIPHIILETPQRKEFGDLSTNLAMQICKLNKGQNPNKIASFVRESLRKNISKTGFSDYIQDISIKGPGFINFSLSNAALCEILNEIQHQAAEFGATVKPGAGKKALIEFVSANPTGPLTVAHARQAVVGNAIANILKFFGWNVTREYYLNDEGRQITLLGESIYARYAELAGFAFEFPRDGYKGDYIKDIAKQIYDKYGKKFTQYTGREKDFFCGLGADSILGTIRKDLSDIGVEFDNYVSQAELNKSEKIKKALTLLKEKGLTYELEGALWFRSTDFGDDKDRVLIKSDKTQTYITADIAYHKDKYDRGFDWLIDMWGPDHHGYIGRIKAAQQALGKEDSALSILIVQLATIYRSGKPARMSTRAGEFISLREIIDEVGADAARFHFLMRKISSHLDFDLEIAKSESMENPVYYIQYAHARICGILQRAKELNKIAAAADFLTKKSDSSQYFSVLKEPEELDLLRKLRQFSDVLYSAYQTLEPYRIIEYLLELAGSFHSFYAKHKVISDDEALTQARLVLIRSVKFVISNALSILGISIPKKM